MDDGSQVENQRGSSVGRDVIVKRGDFVGRDKITNIFGLARWQTYLLLLAVALVSATLVVVIFPHVRSWFVVKIPAPNPVHLQPVHSSQGMHITALATDKNYVWGGAVQSGRYFLFRVAHTQGAGGAIEQLSPPIANQITDLHIDCRGNLWVLVEELGTLLYNPISATTTPWINRQTNGSTLTKNTMHAVASGCQPDGSIDVWLGREGVHTVQYADSATSVDDVQFVPPTADDLYQATKNITEVTALLSVNDSLWVAGANGSSNLTIVSPVGMTQPQSFALGEELLALGHKPGSDTLWAGGYTQLFEVSLNSRPKALALADPNQEPLGIRAARVAVDADYVWLGDDCSFSGSSACCSLAVYIPQNEAFACVTQQFQDVSAFVIDAETNLWIGTDLGLFVYPKPS